MIYTYDRTVTAKKKKQGPIGAGARSAAITYCLQAAENLGEAFQKAEDADGDENEAKLKAALATAAGIVKDIEKKLTKLGAV